MKDFSLRIFALFGILMAMTIAAEAAQIGIASVVKNDVRGTVSGRTQVLRVGTTVFQNEVVSTGADSSTQLLFRDETSLTVGASSSIRLDRFVYNPNTKNADVVVSITKGAFRFVTGSGDPRGYRINTPVASIGIRGTIIEGYLSSDGGLVLVVIEGSIIVTTPSGGSVTLGAGEYISISPSGVISGPRDWTGPTLDLNAGVQFALDDKGILLERPGSNLPSRDELNDALDSKDIIIKLPPEKREEFYPPNGINQSDSRLKHDIELLHVLENGLRIYRFKYLWDDVVHVGVMAQDLLNDPVRRKAVKIMPGGYYGVDYAALGLRMATGQEWSRYGIASIRSTWQKQIRPQITKAGASIRKAGAHGVN